MRGAVLPARENCFALDQIKFADALIFVVGIAEDVGGGDFLENGAADTVETVPGAPLHQDFLSAVKSH